MGQAKRSLDVLTVRSPCTEDWDLMEGSDTVRHCEVCDRSVYDLSGLTREDAEALVSQREGAPCVRFYRRADGTTYLCTIIFTHIPSDGHAYGCIREN